MQLSPILLCAAFLIGMTIGLLIGPVDSIEKDLDERQSSTAGLALPCKFQTMGTTPKPTFHPQVTDIIECGSASGCNAGKLNSQSFSYSVKVTGSNSFIDESSDIAESRTSGTTYQ